MNNPEVSIITPVYNGYKFIEETVRSVSQQTFNNFEWIIIDDSSTDMTHILLQKAADADSRIKLIRLEKNRGAMHARNTGFRAAGGRYIAFLDIDDQWMPEKLEKQLSFMKKHDSGLSYTGYRKVNLDNVVTSRKVIPVPFKTDSHRLKKTCSIMASSAMYDTSKTGMILQAPDVPYKDDLHLWLRILEKVDVAHGLKEDLARLRIHSDSLTGNKLIEAKRQWIFYRNFLKLSFVKSLYYFIHYAICGTCKYLL